MSAGALGPVDGYQLEDALGHAFVVSPMDTRAPIASELSHLRACLAWWQQFVGTVATDYDAQQRRLQKPPYLLAADGAYASRVGQWVEHVMRELNWRVLEANRAAVRRVADGTAGDADRQRAASRPTAPASPRPRWREAPPDWPIAVSCDGRVAAFYRARVDAYRAAATA